MVKKLVCAVLALAMAFMSGSAAFASEDYSISSEHTTVVNKMPHFTVYCETDTPKADKLTVSVDGVKAKITSTKPYSEYDKGVTYYILVDISKSMKSDVLDNIKSATKQFCDKQLTDEDSVYILPVGDEGDIKFRTKAAEPGSKELTNAIDSLEIESKYSYIYRALDTVGESVEHDVSEAADDEILKRNVVIFFTDAKDNTRGGDVLKEEAADRLKTLGVPLYAFTVGNNMQGKDNMKTVVNTLNGRMFSGNMNDDLKTLKNLIDNTLVLDAEAVNAKAACEDGVINVVVDGPDMTKAVEVSDIVALKSGRLSNSIGYSIKMFFAKFWWIILIIAIALIAFIWVSVIRNHKGIVNIDGETVFNDNIEKHKHIKVAENKFNVKTVIFNISIRGSEYVRKKVEITESLIVGRSSANDVSFDDPRMSGQHFYIQLQGEKLIINDLNSKNGTFLNGVRVTVPQQLNQNDIITAGESKIVVQW